MNKLNLALILAAAAVALPLPAATLADEAAPAARTAVDDGVLGVGDMAPPLAAGEFVQGEPVEALERGTVYVIEFWATWCGPCVDAIPHVNELQNKYEGDVVVIGQNVWENDEAAVEPFIERMGDDMGYRVAYDDENKMAETWMAAAGQNGIPCSFIVDREGRVAWIGHPMAMDEPLAKVVAGDYDIETAKAEAARAAEAEQRMMALQGEIQAAMQAGDTDKVLSLLDEVAQVQPEVAPQIVMAKVQVLTEAGRDDEVGPMLEQAVSGSDDPQVLNAVAWTIVQPGSTLADDHLALGLEAAEKADAATGGAEPAVLDTLARAHHRNGDVDKAIELQTKAVGLAEDPMLLAELKNTLAEYEAGVE